MLALCAAILGVPPSQLEKTTDTTTPLVADVPAERELAGGAKHSYWIALADGESAAVVVEQQGIDVLGRFLSTDGSLITEFDSESRVNGTERADLVATASGNYKLEIEARYKVSAAGRYKVVVTGLHRATEQDRLLQEARKLHAEAQRLANSGNYDQAGTVLDKALKIREPITGLDQAEAARSLLLMGNIYYYRSEYSNAESTYIRTCAIFEKTVGSTSPLLATCLNNLASLYLIKENFVKSETIHQQALAIREKELPAEHPDIAQSLGNLANVYLTKGDFVSAEPLYVRALVINEKILGLDHVNLAAPLNNLAQTYVKLGNFERAEELFRRSLNIREQKLGADHPDVALVLSRLGLLYSDKRDYATAQDYLKKALAIYEKRLAPNHSLIALALHNLGFVAYLRRDFDVSESFYQQALRVREASVGPEHAQTVLTIGNLEAVYVAKKDYVRALALQSRVIAATENNIALNLAAGSERQKLAYLAGLNGQFNETVSLHALHMPDDPVALELAASVVLQRKGRVLDVVSDSFAALRRRSSAGDRALMDELNQATASLATLVLDGPQKMTPAEYESHIQTLQKQRETLENEVARRSAGFYEQSHPLALSEIQSAIPDEAALIEFAVYRPPNPFSEQNSEPHYIAYIVRKNGALRWKELDDAKVIDEAVTNLRKALRDPKSRDVLTVARQADAKIMEPIRALTGNATQLLISPDGSLNLIPFEALVDEHGKYLVESYSFTYLTSGRDLMRLNVARPSRSGPVAFAAPLFDGAQPPQSSQLKTRGRRGNEATRKGALANIGADFNSIYFAPLDGTRQEVLAIRALYPNTTVFEREQATEAALKQVAAPQFLHIATHGFFLPADAAETSQLENPLLRSGLALTGANLHSGDGILTALEASGLNLWGTRLVTLSACDTGVGEVLNGEGVYGLRRAIVLAGAETLVMSLWPVSDAVTRDMMIAYYHGLQRGVGRGEALRQVQLQMLHNKTRQHPYYWASFIQSGAWSPLEDAGGHSRG